MATAYDTAKIILPQGSGVKAGTTYGWNPTNNSLVEFTASRTGTTATRVNEDGVRESVVANITRWDWSEGLGCPSALNEPARTNLFPQDLSGSGVVTRTITVTNGTEYTVSVEGSGSMVLSGAGTGTVTEGSHVTFTASSTSLTLTLTGSLDYCQVEAGAYPTSIIFTELVPETRNADNLSATGLGSLLGQSEGTLYLEIMPFQIGTIQLYNSVTERVWTEVNNNVNKLLINNGGGSVTLLNNTTPSALFAYRKISFSYAVNNFGISVNGVDASATPTQGTFNPSTLSEIRFNFGTPFYGRIRVLAAYDYAFNSTERNNATS